MKMEKKWVGDFLKQKKKHNNTQESGKMSKFYNPRDYDTIGFGKNRRHVLISDEENRKRAAASKKKQNKHKKMKHANEDFWKVWEKENESKY